jgi:hypothetical protein
MTNKDEMLFNYCFDFNYKRHLTKEQAEAFADNWIKSSTEREIHGCEILYKKKSNDYTVRYTKKWLE